MEEIRNEETMKEEATKAEPKKEISGELKAMEAARQAVARGKFELLAPIMSNGKEVKALQYDFTKLTGMEYVRAMGRADDGSVRKNSLRITEEQALSLFAAAAAKASEDVDARDILDQIGIDDSIKAIQAATTFFIASSRAGNYRISNA